MKHPPIPQSEVLAWLAENHPQLHAVAEIKGNWVWLVVDLRGDHNKPIREAIKTYGFRFHFRGGHALPSGRIGTWAHSCDTPTRFKFRGKAKKQDSGGEISDDDLLATLEHLFRS